MKTQEEIEQLADKKYLQRAEAISDSTIKGYIVSATKGGFIDGYTQCQEDMADKKYTEEDLRIAFDTGYYTRDSFGDRSNNMTAEEYINSLNKQD